LAISVLGVVISIYYYFGWVRTVYFSDSKDSAPEIAGSLCSCDRVVLGALVVATVLVGIFPGVLPIIP